MKSKYNLSEKPITPWYKDSSFLFLPIYLSIQFIKTDRFKNVNKTIRCCLIAAFWVALFLFAGLSGTSGHSAHELETTQPIDSSIVYVPKTHWKHNRSHSFSTPAHTNSTSQRAEMYR